jgi:hypothetical protein
MATKIRSGFIELVSSLLILLFVYTATSKLLDLPGFRATLERSPLIGNFSYIISWTVPVIELAISTMLFIPMFRQPGFLLSFILMSLFTFYIGYMLLFTPDLPCSCGGVIKSMGWRDHLLFNILFTLLAFTGWLLMKHKRFIAINRISRTPV